ncbi:arylsulfatase [Bradyrhizobium shewense]|uniref:Arylsulfatase n=1 Tax=Bradyrhizobium shewense TaxID=1761772 RepID=A0A1C3X0J0_9BRAD|nr:arylsulfatase [Bradyrhizobium shewense]
MIDIVPTLLEATGIPAPVTIDGIAQKPIEGVSLAYTFDKAKADAPSPHRTQYFEMMGVQGIYNDGWMLSAIPQRAPWDLAGNAVPNPASAFKFELYDVKNDWTQMNDLAAANATKVQEMRDLMFGEFAKYQVLPLDASAATRLASPRPSVTAGRREFTYTMPVAHLAESVAPSLLNTSYTITADVDVPQGGGEGVVVTYGGRYGGYGLYLLKGKPVFLWNVLGIGMVRWEGGEALAPGKHTLKFDFKYDGLGFATLAFNSVSGIGQSGTGTLTVDGKAVATKKMERTVPIILPIDETFDIGEDSGTPLDDRDYQVPFAFTGKVNKVTVALDPPKLTAEDEKKLMDGVRLARDAK